MKSTISKLLALLCVATLCLTCLPMSVFAAYENTHVNTGNQAYDIVKVAETQAGYLEGSLGGTVAGSNNYQKYGQWYDANVDNIGVTRAAWCAAFVSWCANQAGVPSSTVYYHAYCPYGVNWFKNQGRWQYSASRGGSYTPKAGDIIYFAPAGSTVSSHVGIVRYVSGGYVYTVEGNTSGQHGEVNEGGGCFMKSYALSYNRIYGYGTPNYVESGSSANKIGTYVITASSLNVRAEANTSATILGELANGAIVYVSELSGGWGKVKLSDGQVGWCAIGDYGNYIGVDALGGTGSASWGDFATSIGTDGAFTLVNNSTTDTVGYDFAMPIAIGTNTTPFLSLQITPNSGDGYYFGLTQKDSGYFMMRDCNSGDQLVEATSAPYMTGQETLEIDLRDWWTTKDYRVDTIRFYVAPSSSITVNYCYFAANSNIVRDTTYNIVRGSGTPVTPPVLAQNNVNLMNPDTLRIVDTNKTGSYTYSNGMLTVSSADEELYEVAFDVNLEYTPEVLNRFLYSVDANVRYDIEMVVTTSEGDRVVSLADDFWPGVCDAKDGDFIPAAEQSAGLDLYSVYTYNNVLPADGKSTIKSVTVQAGGYGTVIVNQIQINDNDALKLFVDDVYKFDESFAAQAPTESTGDINGDGSITTADARLAMLEALGGGNLTPEQIVLADYNGDGEVTTTDARLMMLYALSN